MKRALITGCAGFIGSHLCDLLLSEGWNVVGIDDLSTGNENNISHLKDHPEFYFHKGKFVVDGSVNPGVWPTPIKGCTQRNYYDVVFHLAATASVPKTVVEPLASNNNNVTDTLVLLDAIKGFQRKRIKFVFSSSSAVYGSSTRLPTQENNELNPISPYALQKLIIEQYCRLYSKLYSIDTVCLRYFNVYGERQNGVGPYANVISSWLTNHYQSKPCLMFGDGSQSRDFVYVKDVCYANLKAALSNINRGEAINVGTGIQVYVSALLLLIQQHVPGFSVEQKSERVGDVEHTLSNISLMKLLLGWVPSTDFITSMESTINWYKENYDGKNSKTQ